MENINAGKKIKDAREARGFTQEELAALLGYSHRSAVNKLESKSSLQTKTLEKVADILGISLAKLMGFE